MAKLPEKTVARLNDSTVSRIFKAYEARSEKMPRAHLGASLIGHDCDRYLWLSFRWFFYPNFKGRILRLFNRGFREEPVLVSDLRAAGCTVHDSSASTGTQFSFSAVGGHFGGSMDAAILGLVEAPKTWHVGEFKTMSKKKFAEMEKDKLEKANPVYYAQCQTYMKFTGMKRASFWAVCKDDDRIYHERVKYDGKFAAALFRRAERVITADQAPDRISTNPSWFKCKWCDAFDLCQGRTHFPRVNCRTCCHSTPKTDGEGYGPWICERKSSELSPVDQVRACEYHLFNPSAMPIDHVDADPAGTWVKYKTEDDRMFYNLIRNDLIPTGAVSYHSDELELLTVDEINEPILQDVKEVFGGTVSGSRLNNG